MTREPREENPLRTLVAMKEHRQGREVAAMLVGAAVALGLLQSEPFGPPEAGLLMVLGCMVLLHMIVIPTLIRPADTSLLVTLRRGRALPDLMGAGVTPAQIVDGLALHALRSPVSGVAVFLGLLALPVLRADLDASHVHRWAGLTLSLLLYPVLRVCGSYAAQMLAAWTGDSERVTLPQLALALVVHGPANLLLALAGVQAWHGDLEAGALAALAGLAWVALASRQAALAGLARPEALGFGGTAARSPRGRPRMPAWLHPVVARELLRDLTILPGGLATLVGLNLVTLPVLGLWLETGGRSMGLDGEAVTGLVELPLLGLLVLGTLRAASRSLDGCMVERETRTLELVTTTRMTALEWLDGMALVGWGPRALETLVALGILGAVWALNGLCLAAPLLLGLAVLAALPLSSYLATCCFAHAGSRRDAAVVAYLLLLSGLFLGAILAVGLGAATSAGGACLMLYLASLLALAVRQAARGTLTSGTEGA